MEPSKVLDEIINRSPIEYGALLVEKYGSEIDCYFHSKTYEENLVLNREIRILRYTIII